MTSIAHAATGGAPAGGPGAFGQFLPLILIFVIFYFLLIRPQQKKAKDHRNFLANMKKGDKVVTGGGLLGTITGLTDSVVTLEIADNVRIKVTRGSIAGAQGSDKEGEKQETTKKILGG